MITQELRYAAMFIQETSDRQQATVRHVAEQYGMSAKFLEQVAGKLRRAGIIFGRRGKAGGYRMARQKVSLADVLAALGHSLPSISCRLADDCRGGAMCEEREIEAKMIGEMNDSFAQMAVTR